MSRIKPVYICQECAYESLKWLGRCPNCDSWNSFAEEFVLKEAKARKVKSKKNLPQKLVDISFSEEERIDTGISELNRVLGGGLVPGALIMLAGDPGIGKSTLTLQCANLIDSEAPVLYVSGEESPQQIKMRAARLGADNPHLLILAETNLELIEEVIKRTAPKLVILDSVQTVYLPQISSAPGSVSQLRECTARILDLIKREGIPTILVGHVTKEGSVAGPRVLEHMVDAVLYFEGERHYQYRVLRGLKNRFGSTNELGIFEMSDQGLKEVLNPSQAFLAERPKAGFGSVAVACMEGSRSLLIELQALVSATSFGQPRRMTSGTDYNRVNMIMAVLEKSAGLFLGSYDAYVNIAGGLKVQEPALDLAMAAALASSFKNKVISSDLVVVGEIGLTGEVRAISHLDKRLAEAAKLGFKRAVIPAGNLKNMAGKEFPLKVEGVKTVLEALDLILI